MHLLTVLSLKNRALIALVTIVAAVFGALSMQGLKQELMPSVQLPTIAVISSYPGASPEVVNNDVSTPIETALRSVPQLETTTASSSTGSSTVLAQFEYGIDLASTEQKIERAISRISGLLPSAVETQVLSGGIEDFPVIQVAATPSDGMTAEEAASLLTRIAVSEINDLPGVREASLLGARGDRVSIIPDETKLVDRGLSAQDLTAALQQSGVLMAAGTVTEGEQTLAVQLGATLHSAEDVAAIPVPLTTTEMLPPVDAAPAPGDFDFGDAEDGSASPESVTPTTIGDLAEVKLEPNPETSISRIDGQPALTIAVTKTSSANTVEISHAVQEKLEELDGQLEGITLSIVFDQAPYIEESVETLTTEGLLGLLFAVLVILVFLMSVRATIVTAISIPTSVLLTFIALNSADYTLNLLTLGALTISIGRVVDDSIVVIENIKRHLSTAGGGDAAQTIVRAVREVAGAITASTLTSAAVFLPMAFVGGMVGELFRPFAFTATFALAASLIVSLTIVPVLAYWFLKVPEAGAPKPRIDEDAVNTWMQRGYRPIIEWTLRKPGVTLLIAALVFGGTIALSPLMKTNFMGADEQNSIGLTQTLAPGTSLSVQTASAERVEEALAELANVETVQTSIGGMGGAAALFGAGGSDGVVTYSITTDASADQSAVQDEIRAAVDELEDAGEFSIGMSDAGMTMSSAIEIHVTAPDQATLTEASDAVVAALHEEADIVQIESDLAESRPYLSVRVDRTAAAEVGLTEAAVAGLVVEQMQPQQIGQITIDDATVNVYLASGSSPADADEVARIDVPTILGERRLDSLATIEVADGPVTIHTGDTSRMVTVSALAAGDDLGTAGTAVTRALEAVELPPGAGAEIGGVMAQQEEAFEQLGIALLVAILIVYVIMVATFRSLLQPLLLLISIPFAATGAILLLVLTGIPLGVASLIGVIMLIGIVVTNAIVLVDLVNQYRSRGEPLREAVLHGSLQRLRPIVMTALATILALTPMGIGITGQAGGFISQPLAIVVIGGLLSSTVLTLIVLPTLYYLAERRRETGRTRRRERRSARLAVATAGAAVGTAGTAVVPAVPDVDLPGEHAAPQVNDADASVPDTGDAAKAHAHEGSAPVFADRDSASDTGERASSSVERGDDIPEPGDATVEIDVLSKLDRRFASGEPEAASPTAQAEVPPTSAAADSAEASAYPVIEIAPLVFPEGPDPETKSAAVDVASPEPPHADVPLDESAGSKPVREHSSILDLEAQNRLLQSLRKVGLDAPLGDKLAAAEAEAEAEAEAAAKVEAAESAGAEAAEVAEVETGEAAEPEAAPEHAEPAVASPSTLPVTGEVNWEELMWQATQEVDDEDERE